MYTIFESYFNTRVGIYISNFIGTRLGTYIRSGRLSIENFPPTRLGIDREIKHTVIRTSNGPRFSYVGRGEWCDLIRCVVLIY